MALELVRTRPEHIEELGRITYEAFRDVSEAHGFPVDLPDVEVARHVIGMLVGQEGFYGVTALVDGRPVGSNFMSLLDPVAGVGPITVDRAHQGHGVGKALMADVLQHARVNGVASVRLLQDGFNTVSLSLYTRLGFQFREAIALMDSAAAPESDGTVRPAVAADLPAMDRLCRRIYRVSRKGETTVNLRMGASAFVRERAGRLMGYLVPGFLGHGVAESTEDAIALVRQSARSVPPGLACFFCPLRHENLFRQALESGCRLRKVMNLMSVGDYEAPEGVWMPSISY